MRGNDMLLSLLKRQLDLEKVLHLLIAHGLEPGQRERLLQVLRSEPDEQSVDVAAKPGSDRLDEAAPTAFALFLSAVERSVELDRKLSGKPSE